MENTCSCNFLVATVTEASKSEPWFAQQLKKIPTILNTASGRVKYNFYRMTTPKSNARNENDHVNLQPGDWVEVRTMREISLTLDHKGRNKGLYFMPEMEAFCGKEYRIFKKAEIIKLESTGEIRKLRSPAFFLEGVHCNGKFQGGCDRACFHFWRDIWLKKLPNSDHKVRI
jgi:hypothetical protein